MHQLGQEVAFVQVVSVDVLSGYDSGLDEFRIKSGMTIQLTIWYRSPANDQCDIRVVCCWFLCLQV